jgi:hypothetical protein
MEQEVFNQLIANSPAALVLLYMLRQISTISERVARIEGKIETIGDTVNAKLIRHAKK